MCIAKKIDLGSCSWRPPFKGLSALLRDLFREEQAVALEANLSQQGVARGEFEELKMLSAEELEKMSVEKLGDRKRLLVRVERLDKDSRWSRCSCVDIQS